MNLKPVFPAWTWLIYTILFVFSIPWYLPEKIAMDLVLGLPIWVLTCIGAIVLMAGFTVVMIHLYWVEES